jgi:hypothetical protein
MLVARKTASRNVKFPSIWPECGRARVDETPRPPPSPGYPEGRTAMRGNWNGKKHENARIIPVDRYSKEMTESSDASQGLFLQMENEA